MATASGVAPQVVSGTTPLPTKDASGATLSSTAGSTLAGNFQTFLTLLTTQLQNQNPLDPLDTNQFTQQLVQFAGVEQQLKTNDQLTSLVVAAADRAVDAGDGFRRQDRGGRRQHHESGQRRGELELKRSDKLERRHHHRQLDRPERVTAAPIRHRRRQPGFYLGRQGQ